MGRTESVLDTRRIVATAGLFWGIESREKGEGMDEVRWADVWLVGALVLNRKISLE